MTKISVKIYDNTKHEYIFKIVEIESEDFSLREIIDKALLFLDPNYEIIPDYNFDGKRDIEIEYGIRNIKVDKFNSNIEDYKISYRKSFRLWSLDSNNRVNLHTNNYLSNDLSHPNIKMKDLLKAQNKHYTNYDYTDIYIFKNDGHGESNILSDAIFIIDILKIAFESYMRFKELIDGNRAIEKYERTNKILLNSEYQKLRGFTSIHDIIDFIDFKKEWNILELANHLDLSNDYNIVAVETMLYYLGYDNVSSEIWLCENKNNFRRNDFILAVSEQLRNK